MIDPARPNKLAAYHRDLMHELEMAESHRLDDMRLEQQVNGGLAHAAKVFALALPAQPQQVELPSFCSGHSQRR